MGAVRQAAGGKLISGEAITALLDTVAGEAAPLGPLASEEPGDEPLHGSLHKREAGAPG
jgi:hypothetical protein